MGIKNLQRSSTVKEKWECNNVISEGEHSSTAGLDQWSQRNYTCSFCKRGFRSAQALGGHMNVHRRDRAKLRQLPSWFFECPNLATSNSDPKPLLPSSSSKFLPYHDHSLFSPSLTSLSSPSYPQKKSILKRPQSTIDLTKKKGNTGAPVLGVGELKKKNVTQERDQLQVLRRNEVVSLDLETGCEDSKEVLDLELRLGCF